MKDALKKALHALQRLQAQAPSIGGSGSGVDFTHSSSLIASSPPSLYFINVSSLIVLVRFIAAAAATAVAPVADNSASSLD